MAEISWYWGGSSTGDAANAPYDDDEFSDIWRKLFQLDRTTMGYISGYLSELALATPDNLTVRVASGAALVDGKLYENDSNFDISIPTPSGSTRIDRIVLRKSWADQEVRLFRIGGVEGGGAPAITQTDGVTWDIILAEISVTTVPVITLTDQRIEILTPLANIVRYFEASLFGFAEDIAVGDGAGYFVVPDAFDGMVLVEAKARVITAGTTGTLDIQVANVTQAADMFSTVLTIDTGETSSETAATPAVIDTGNDDVAADDLLRIDVDVVHTTPAKGLIVTLGFQFE